MPADKKINIRSEDIQNITLNQVENKGWFSYIFSLSFLNKLIINREHKETLFGDKNYYFNIV